MKKRPSNNFAKATALLLGTTIGAGIFGMPYVFAKSGFLAGLVHLIVLGAVLLFVNLLVGEVALRTRKVHMLTGFAKKYLGKGGEYLMFTASAFGIFGAMVAYIIGEGEVLSAILGGSPFVLSLAFFAVVSVIIFFDLKAVAESDLIFVALMIGIVVLLSALAIPRMDFVNLSSFNPSNFLLPYGVVLFAMVGASAIPEMEQELRHGKKYLKRAIFWGTLIPILIYLVFTLVVVGVTGVNTTEVATVGLGETLGPYMVLLGNIFAALAMATSFITLGLAKKWMLHYDYGVPKKLSWFITILVPLFIFLMGAGSFIGVVGITGVVAGGLEGILLVLIAKAAKKKGDMEPQYKMPLNWFIMALLILLFLAGMSYEFFF